jgi:hypothetical protein
MSEKNLDLRGGEGRIGLSSSNIRSLIFIVLMKI